MKESNLKNIERIDRLIFGFLILFAGTLNNSIFLCQIGFFGAYILMGIKYYLNKENPFQKTGLEMAFIIYFGSVFISAIFSVDKGEAFVFFGKHILLVPIVYLLSNAAGSEEKAKTIFKVYLAFALATLLVYLGFSLKHFIAHLYQMESKGPSPFQYVMTAGGLMTFTALFFFALLVNEKRKWWIRLFYLAAFGLSFSAVIASYTRAAWLGMFAGLFVILLIKRNWYIIAPAILVLAYLSISSKNESKVTRFNVEYGKLKQEYVLDTEGRAVSAEFAGVDTVLVACYNKGILVLSNGKEIQKIKTPAPINHIRKWKNSFYICYSLDTRIFVLKKNLNGKFEIAKVFVSPGEASYIEFGNDMFYTSDIDSGLTVYRDPEKVLVRETNRTQTNINRFGVGEGYFAAYYSDPGRLMVYTLKNNLPDKFIDSLHYEASVQYVWVNGSHILFQADNYLIQYTIENLKLVEKRKDTLPGLVRMRFDDSTAYALSIDGKIFKAALKNGVFEFAEITNLHSTTHDFCVSGKSIYITSFKRNRILSLIDPYHDTNFERMNIWKTGLKIFKDYPIVGVGDIDLGNLYREYKDYYLKSNFGHLHNNFMQWLVTLGILGLAAVMFMFFKLFMLNVKIYKTVKNEPFVSSYALGSISVLVAFLFAGLGEYNFGDQEIITMVWFTIGLNIAFYKNYLKQNALVV